MKINIHFFITSGSVLLGMRNEQKQNAEKIKHVLFSIDRLCGLVVRVSGYRYRGLGFGSQRYQIF